MNYRQMKHMTQHNIPRLQHSRIISIHIYLDLVVYKSIANIYRDKIKLWHLSWRLNYLNTFSISFWVHNTKQSFEKQTLKLVLTSVLPFSSCSWQKYGSNNWHLYNSKLTLWNNEHGPMQYKQLEALVSSFISSCFSYVHVPPHIPADFISEN